MKVDGLHHVTAITADIDTNLEFYGRLLGLRPIWQGVNADDPGMRHVAYGDEREDESLIAAAAGVPDPPEVKFLRIIERVEGSVSGLPGA